MNLYRNNFSFINQKAPFFEGTASEFLKQPFTLASNQDKLETIEKLDIKTYLEKINLAEDVLEKEFSSLSGGEQQRLSILQILLLDKTILLLDEITSALDKTNRDKVISLILDEENKGKTVIIVSHSNEEWLKTGKITRVINIEKGEIVSQVQ